MYLDHPTFTILNILVFQGHMSLKYSLQTYFQKLSFLIISYLMIKLLNVDFGKLHEHVVTLLLLSC